MNQDSHTTAVSALCVGGPFAGRIVAIPKGQRILQFHQWPKPLEAFIAEGNEFIKEGFGVMHQYRWVHSSIGCGIASFDGMAVAHTSMTDEEANRCVLAFVVAAILQQGMKPHA